MITMFVVGFALGAMTVALVLLIILELKGGTNNVN